jgi:acetyl-CoA synthetase
VLSVGEPLNPEVIEWGWKTLGVRIHDTWWMTETGAQLIVNLSHQTIRLGSVGKPLPGIEAAILDDSLLEVPRGELGQLAIKTPWPSLMKTVWNNPQKYASYFTEVKNRGVFYLSGDTARMDEDGYVYFIGRGDDVIVTSGEKVSPFEVESTLITHSKVAEAGVIAKPDPIRGDIVKAFVVLRDGVQASGELAREIRDFVKTRLSAHAYPREVEIVAALPKTRVSGKIMRRVLKAWETGGDIGDTTTLENGQRITLASSND